MDTESFGMMSKAFFVSRLKIINWINDLLELEIKKIEHCAPGAIYCQVVDSVYGQSVTPMKNVNFSAKYKHEFINNYKLLQKAFLKIGLKKSVPVEKLIEGKYQDNLEFCQWLYQWYQKKTGTEEAIEYNAFERRCLSRGGADYIHNIRPNNSSELQKPISKNLAKNRKTVKKTLVKQNKTNLKPKNDQSRAIEELKSQVQQLEKVGKEIEKERDFYFEKVLKIEKICSIESYNQHELKSMIQQILYEKTSNEENNKESNYNFARENHSPKGNNPTWEESVCGKSQEISVKNSPDEYKNEKEADSSLGLNFDLEDRKYNTTENHNGEMEDEEENEDEMLNSEKILLGES